MVVRVQFGLHRLDVTEVRIGSLLKKIEMKSNDNFPAGSMMEMDRYAIELSVPAAAN